MRIAYRSHSNLLSSVVHILQTLDIFFFFFNFLKFIYFERARESEPVEGGAGGGAEREEDTGSQAGSVLTAEILTWGSDSQTGRS